MDATRPDDAPSDPVFFDAVLRPNRSLGPTGFLVLMALFGAISFAAGIAFLVMGAWPVFGFFGLDVALVYLAFRLNYRAGRLTETIRLDRRELEVRRIQPNGRSQRWTFQPYWVRVQHPDPEEHDSPLLLSSHGRRLSVGAFLAPEERADLADALDLALARHRTQA